MQAAIGYLRVSTREQGRRGFSLETQRRDIGAFGAREGFTITSWYQDVQTGGGADALQLRPGLGGSTEGGKVDSISADCLEARPPIAQRPLHQRPDGTSSALHHRSARERLRSLCSAHLCIACGAGTEADLRTQQSCSSLPKAQRASVRPANRLEG